MANWQLMLNIAGLALVYFSGKFAKSTWNTKYEEDTISFIYYGAWMLSTLALGIIFFHAALLKPVGSHTLKSLVRSYFMYHMLIPTLGRFVHRKLLKAMKDPLKHQDDLLMSILKENQKTVFATEHGLDKIKCREQFVDKCPLTTFPDYEKYVDRIAEGEKNVMTKAEVIHLALTSGTSGRNKMYPITDHDLRIWQSMGLALLYNSVKVQDINLSRELCFKLSNPIRRSNAGITIGSLTACRKPVNFSDILPPIHMKVMKEKPSFFIQALFGLLEKDIGMIQGYSGDLMYSFFKSMEHNRGKLFQAIETGHIEPFPELDDDIRDELNKLLTPDEDRAEDLRDIFAEGSVGLAKRIWPNITFTNIAKTGGFHPAAKILENSYLKGVKCGFFLHGGTEGLCGIGMSVADMEEEICTLVPTGVFMEFIKVEDMEEESPKTYLIDELELGQLYEVVITNYHGLYRIRCGDVIKVVGYTNKTPKYIFQHRTGQILNCGLDRTTEKSFYDALTDSESEWNLTVQNYTTTESLNLEAANGEKYGRNHYVAFIEFEDGVLLTKEQCDMLEANLFKRQESYAEFRGVKSLGPVNIIQTKPRTFNRLRKLIFQDRPHMQFTTPRVIRNAEYLSFLWENRIPEK